MNKEFKFNYIISPELKKILNKNELQNLKEDLKKIKKEDLRSFYAVINKNYIGFIKRNNKYIINDYSYIGEFVGKINDIEIYKDNKKIFICDLYNYFLKKIEENPFDFLSDSIDIFDDHSLEIGYNGIMIIENNLTIFDEVLTILFFLKEFFDKGILSKNEDCAFYSRVYYEIQFKDVEYIEIYPSKRIADKISKKLENN